MAPTGWGPRRQRAAISLSFDNLGEAAALQRGDPVDPARLGRDPTADFVPRLLALLGELPATYFIEASNVARYPGAILAWHAAGKEVAMHAWQHEHWAGVPAPDRRRLLRIGVAAFQTLGIRPAGFRPPGGQMPDGALQELRDAGLGYCSPLGEAAQPAVEQGLAVLPFAWPHVDAFVLDPTLHALRERFGAPAAASPQRWRAGLDTLLAHVLAHGCHATVVFHPYLLLRGDGLDTLVQWLHTLRESPDVWVAACGDVADALTIPCLPADSGAPSRS